MTSTAQEWYHDYVSEDKGHGRIERREVTTCGQPDGGDYFDHTTIFERAVWNSDVDES